MSFVLKLHGVVIGRSELEDRDPATRIASGAFRKGAGYELVEPVFALRDQAEGPSRYRRARDTLSLQLFDASGALIDTASVDIAPADAAGKDLRIRIAVPDPAFWR
jgi:hypothetical protein